MVYIYRKTIGDKKYYYLRASVRKNGKIVVKDIKFLGSDIHAIQENLKNIPHVYDQEIRKTYRTINKFLEVNIFLEKVKREKLKKDLYLDNDSLENIEACRRHWQERFQKLDELTKKEILKHFVIAYAFNTASIEGNTITLKQARDLLTEERVPKDKSLREIYDVQNTEKVFMMIIHERRDVSHEFIQEIHRRLLEHIDPREGYRTGEVRVFKAAFKSTPAPYVKTDMGLLLQWYHEQEKKIHPFVLAILFHHKFEKIHPFMDGNGRTGRMLMNSILLQHDSPPIIIRKKNRTAYLDVLHKADHCPITRADKNHYAELLEFATNEYKENYWNIFL
ncbi:MAG: Fic family protein [Nanoarchaeota archaeon]